MQSARTTLPEEPAGGVTRGIDWARDDHAVSVVDARGREISRRTVEHSAAGLRELTGVLARAGAREAAIERPDGPVIDTLLGAGVTVVVISPNQVKNLRGRYGSAGNKDDRFDAFVLADTLRTDRARLRPLTPDTPATVCAAPRLPRPQGPRRATASPSRTSCAPTCATRLPRRSRPVRRHRLPGQPGVPGPLRHPGPRRLAQPPAPGRLAGQRRLQRPHRPRRPARPPDRCTPRRHRRRRPAPTPASPAPCSAVLTTLAEQIKTLSGQIAEQLAQHADAHIFTSLPRSGTVRAARLLAEIGDCRARFPTPESLACLAGAAPSTRQSGKMRTVGFRWACDKQLRDAVTDFAGDSRRASPWAADLYNRARARGHDHPHAVRILARAWLFVIWHCWQDGAAYDPARHRALQTLLNQDQRPGA